MSKTAKQYIATNDFEGCLKRYEHAQPNWKNHWLNTLHEIFNTFKQWAKKYVFDPIAQMYKKRKTNKPRSHSANIIFENPIDEANIDEGGAYVIEHYDAKGKRLWLKIGEAVRFRTRFNQLRKEEYTIPYKAKVAKIVVKKLYVFDNANMALTMENILRNYFQSKSNTEYVPKDRFVSAFWTEQDEIALKTKHFQINTLFA